MDRMITLEELCPKMTGNLLKAPFVANLLHNIPKRYHEEVIMALGFSYVLGSMDGNGIIDD